MSETLDTSLVDFGEHKLSITTRYKGDIPELLADITTRTIRAWLDLAGFIERQEWTLPEDKQGSVESRLVNFIRTRKDNPVPNFTLTEIWGDARVTIWDKNGIDFHLNSSDDFQVAIDTWRAHKIGIQRALDYYNQNVQNPAKTSANSSATASQATTPSTTPQNAPNTAYGSVFYTKKEAIAKLQSGDSFKMKVVQIKKRSQDGKDYYEIFEPYGGKPGDFAAVSVFTDNEIAINNGLIAYLDSFRLKVGQTFTDFDMIANCTVGKSKTKIIKGEEKTFTNIYINSFEGQPVPA